MQTQHEKIMNDICLNMYVSLNLTEELGLSKEFINS